MVVEITDFPLTQPSKNTSENKNKQKEPDFISVVERAHGAIEHTHTILEQATKSAALRAFRATQRASKTNKLPVPVLNRVGNKRGIVISKRARAIYDITFQYAENIGKYERALGAAAFLIEIAKDSKKYSAVWNENIPLSQKAVRCSALATSEAIKAASGDVMLGAHLVALSMKGYFDLGDKLGVPGSADASRRISDLDQSISTHVEEWLDPDNMYRFGSRAVSYVKIHLSFK